MNKTNLLGTSKSGFTLYSPVKRTFQLSFGNFILNLTTPGFIQFTDFIDHLTGQYFGKGDPVKRMLEVGTPYQGISFLLSYEELSELNELLIKSRKELIQENFFELN
mgnify:CR=1 FL=1